jgi:hypothetical protein
MGSRGLDHRATDPFGYRALRARRSLPCSLPHGEPQRPANPKGVFFKLGLLSEVDVLLAGPSNAGLADPGHSTALSFLQTSTALGSVTRTGDSLVMLTVLAKLEDEVGALFMDAHRRLEADEAG